MSRVPHLTKSRYTAGLQCLRRLWLDVHDRTKDETEAPAGSPIAVGKEIGQHAHQLFPGGVLVAEEPWEHAAAVARTAALVSDRSVPAIFEAAFEHDHVRIRVDVLERLAGGRWGIREVKSSGEVKDYHYDDAAVQFHVVEKAGLRISSVQILHVNKEYVREEGEISWRTYFRREEIREEAKVRRTGIETRLMQQSACLSRRKAPAIDPGAHCHNPNSCAHWVGCTASKPKDWIYHMPNLSTERREALGQLGIDTISSIPDDFPLSPRQAVIRDVTRTSIPFVADDLPDRLRGFGPPACYLDFEAFSPAIPLYSGTRPFQTIPFQWSLHHVNAKGKVTHQEHLAEGNEDPRRRFAETLVNALRGSACPIIVYSSYEKTRLNELADYLPGLAKPIQGIVDRLADLLPVVRSGVYHPDFAFSNSIKTAAPALAPDITYGDLDEVADGETASAAFWRMAISQADAKESARLRDALLTYCKRDTWAMVRLHQALIELARK